MAINLQIIVPCTVVCTACQLVTLEQLKIGIVMLNTEKDSQFVGVLYTETFKLNLDAMLAYSANEPQDRLHISLPFPCRARHDDILEFIRNSKSITQQSSFVRYY